MSDHEKYDGSFLQQFHATVDLVARMSLVRASSSTTLSWEMTRLLALVIFEGVEIGGPAREN